MSNAEQEMSPEKLQEEGRAALANPDKLISYMTPDFALTFAIGVIRTVLEARQSGALVAVIATPGESDGPVSSAKLMLGMMAGGKH
jgi:hypothetical protein